MKLLLALTGLVALALSVHAGSECQWGASYWCQSMATAQQCQQVQYCQEQVWKSADEKEETPEVQDTKCEICKTVVAYADKLLKMGIVEQEAEKLVEEVCSFLGPLKGECDAIVNQYFDAIWNLLVGELSPDKVCDELRLCTSAEQAPSSPTTSVECTLCTLVVGYIEKELLNNKTEQEAEKLVEEVCSFLGPLKGECDALVNKYFDEIWNYLTNKVSPDEICKLIGLCTSAGPAQFAKTALAMPKFSIKCTLCKVVMNLVHGLVAKNSTEMEAKYLVEKVCGLLGDLSSECDDLLDYYWGTLWQLVVSEVSADVVCPFLFKECKADLKGQSKAPKQGLCDICKLAVSFLKPFVDSNSTEQEVEQAIEGLCKLLPSSISSECDSLVTQYFPLVWALVKSEFDNDKICKQLGLCTNSTRTARPVLQVQSPKRQRKAPKQGVVCDVCELVVKFLKPYVDSNSTELAIEDALKGLCSLLPSTIKSECASLVAQYFPIIWGLVESGFDDKICIDMGFCTKSRTARPVLQVQPPKRSKAPKQTLCDLCKLVVNFVKPYVDNNGTEQEVKDALDQLCGALPSSISAQVIVAPGELAIFRAFNHQKVTCKSLVDNFLPIVWALVKSELENDEICKQLGLCTNSTRTTRPVLQVQSPKRSKAPKQTLCDLCKLVVNFVKPYVDNNGTEKEVQDALDALCGLLPGSISTECKSLVDQYLPIVWALAKSEFDNDKICYQLGLCTNSTRTTRPVLQARSPKRSKAPKQSLCDICKLVVSFLKPFVDSNSTEKDVEDALDALCGLLPGSISKECDNYVKQYFPFIWTLLKMEVDSGQLCQMIGVCNSTAVTKPVPPAQSPKRSKAPKQSLCDLCKLVVSFMKPFVDNNSTEEEVKDALDKVCDLLPSSISTQCDKYVDEYFPLIWVLLKSYVDSGELCQIIGVCNSTAVTKPKPPAVNLPIAPREDLCQICEMVLSFIKPFLENNATENEVKTALEGYCKLLPSAFQKECDMLVDQYFPMIWKLLESYVDDPDETCKLLGLCSNQSVRTPAKVPALPKPSPAVKSAPKAGILCVVCEFVMKELDSMLSSNATEAEIVAALEKVCGFLPSTIRQECDSFVDKYGPVIIELFLQKVSPKLVCSFLGLCSGSAVDTVPRDEACTVCKLVISFVKDIIGSNSTKEEIKKVLEYVCNFLPVTIRSECKTFVDQFEGQIIQLIEDKIDPGVICKDLGVCSTRKTSPLVQPWLKLVRTQ